MNFSAYLNLTYKLTEANTPPIQRTGAPNASPLVYGSSSKVLARLTGSIVVKVLVILSRLKTVVSR